MSCKLYIQSGHHVTYLGTFKDEDASRRYYNFIYEKLTSDLGTDIKPIYVSTGKGRGNNG